VWVLLSSSQTTRVAPSWPWTTTTPSIESHVTVEHRPCSVGRHRMATRPSLNSTPSATTPVPLTPVMSASRCNSNLRTGCLLGGLGHPALLEQVADLDGQLVDRLGQLGVLSEQTLVLGI